MRGFGRRRTEGAFVIGDDIEFLIQPFSHGGFRISADDHGVDRAEEGALDHVTGLTEAAPNVGEHPTGRVGAARHFNQGTHHLLGKGRGVRVIGKGNVECHGAVVFTLDAEVRFNDAVFDPPFPIQHRHLGEIGGDFLADHRNAAIRLNFDAAFTATEKPVRLFVIESDLLPTLFLQVQGQLNVRFGKG